MLVSNLLKNLQLKKVRVPRNFAHSTNRSKTTKFVHCLSSQSVSNSAFFCSTHKYCGTFFDVVILAYFDN
jgi:hypothetical protein